MVAIFAQESTEILQFEMRANVFCFRYRFSRKNCPTPNASNNNDAVFLNNLVWFAIASCLCCMIGRQWTNNAQPQAKEEADHCDEQMWRRRMNRHRATANEHEKRGNNLREISDSMEETWKWEWQCPVYIYLQLISCLHTRPIHNSQLQYFYCKK